MAATGQVGAISSLELCDDHIACFPVEIQEELAIVGSEKKKDRGPGFLDWSEYAERANGRAQLAHAAEAAINIFYLKAKAIPGGKRCAR